jgi:hypothetical protein
MNEAMMAAMQIKIESLERQTRELAEENAAVRKCLTEFDLRHDEDQARARQLAEALRAHHQWHLNQDCDANAWGIDPVDAYSGSGLCEMTVIALARMEASDGSA